ncbi:MAG: hypothetical protein IT332_02330 [Ardenticatenales bacterium]|nr:hypothetical protein [Ardenticatenales bacterium]
MIDLPPRRYEPHRNLAPLMLRIGILAIVAGALMGLSALRSDPVQQIGAGIITVLLGGSGVWSLVMARRTARYGFEHGPAGFRNPKPNAEWRPWSAVETVRVRRGEIVLLDDAGRRLAGFSSMMEGFQDALDDVMAACPHAVPTASLPATFSGRSSALGGTRWSLIAISGLLVAFSAAFFAYQLPAPFAIIATGAVILGVAAGIWEAVYGGKWRRRDRIAETIIDPSGITIRYLQGERRIEDEAIRDVRVIWGDPEWRERRARGERGARSEPGYRVVVRERATTLVAIAPPSVDAVAVYAAVRAMRAGSGDR